MNDDYLWDKSGEPDPEIEQLEEVFGTLRYQHRELQIPADIRPGRKRSYSFGLAIAAAVALVVLGAGVWMGLYRQPKNPVTPVTRSESTNSSTQAAASPVDEKKRSNLLAGATSPEFKPDSNPRNFRSRRSLLATSKRRTVSKLSAGELAEVQATKEQLMLALRVASSKLSLVQKKTQGTSSDTLIHNQHKTG